MRHLLYRFMKWADRRMRRRDARDRARLAAEIERCLIDRKADRLAGKVRVSGHVRRCGR